MSRPARDPPEPHRAEAGPGPLPDVGPAPRRSARPVPPWRTAGSTPRPGRSPRRGTRARRDPATRSRAPTRARRDPAFPRWRWVRRWWGLAVGWRRPGRGRALRNLCAPDPAGSPSGRRPTGAGARPSGGPRALAHSRLRRMAGPGPRGLAGRRRRQARLRRRDGRTVSLVWPPRFRGTRRWGRPGWRWRGHSVGRAISRSRRRHRTGEALPDRRTPARRRQHPPARRRRDPPGRRCPHRAPQAPTPRARRPTPAPRPRARRPTPDPPGLVRRWRWGRW